MAAHQAPRPWDSPGKHTGVGCCFLLQCMKVKNESEVAQSCPTLSDPMDCSLPCSSIHGIFQARVLEWGAIAFSGTHTIQLQFPVVFPKSSSMTAPFSLPFSHLSPRFSWERLSTSPFQILMLNVFSFCNIGSQEIHLPCTCASSFTSISCYFLFFH